MFFTVTHSVMIMKPELLGWLSEIADSPKPEVSDLLTHSLDCGHNTTYAYQDQEVKLTFKHHMLP